MEIELEKDELLEELDDELGLWVELDDAREVELEIDELLAVLDELGL